MVVRPILALDPGMVVRLILTLDPGMVVRPILALDLVWWLGIDKGQPLSAICYWKH